LLLRILLIGYLYGISSARKLVEEMRMHLVWRWFTGLGFDEEVPHSRGATHSQDKVSTTDPDSKDATQGGTPHAWGTTTTLPG